MNGQLPLPATWPKAAHADAKLGGHEFEYGSYYEIDHNGVHIWTISAAEISFLHNQAYTNLFPVLEGP